MHLVLLTALGVGGATIIGALIGLITKKTSQKFNDLILSFAAGVMLSAAILGLILPSIEHGGNLSLLITVTGVFCGALCVNVIDKFVPHLHLITGTDLETPETKIRVNKIMLFVTAIAIHNLPEGIAAGVGFGTGNISEAFIIALGIALQNIPEGMVIIAPMLSVGISRTRTFLIAFMTGVIEIIGTMLGYFAISLSSAILPFALAFAGGTMLYVVSDEIIPETHPDGSKLDASCALLAGFCLMLVLDAVL